MERPYLRNQKPGFKGGSKFQPILELVTWLSVKDGENLKKK